jgi:3-deoxy-D-manno-octulosonate 8-phosphate phosphatase (KDO 8-P phosphatase)
VRCNVRRKAEALQEICTELGQTPADVCYVGDDINDLPALQLAQLPVVVANADPHLLAGPWWRTATDGGTGAVREVIVALLAARGYDLTLPPANGEPVRD